MVDTIKNSPEYKRLINSPTYQERREHFQNVLGKLRDLDSEISENIQPYVKKMSESKEAAKEIY